MPRRKLIVLDVGHGNCTLLQDDNGIVVFDVGPGSALLEFLRTQNIQRIDAILLSHADSDHIEGLIALLNSSEIAIGEVRYNSDGSKKSQLYDDLAYSLEDYRKRGLIDCQPSLTSADSGKFVFGKVNIQILAPNTYIAAKSPGSKDKKGRTLNSNSNSAVIRLIVEDMPIALIPGDIDLIGLDNLLADNFDISAPILIFPHHGGFAGSGSITKFTEILIEETKPNIVIFSIDRKKHNNPKPEIINTISRLIPNISILCTQLSSHCSNYLPTNNPMHLNNYFAAGKVQNKCCGGTIEIDLETPFNINNSISPRLGLHKNFVEKFITNSMCLK